MYSPHWTPHNELHTMACCNTHKTCCRVLTDTDGLTDTDRLTGIVDWSVLLFTRQLGLESGSWLGLVRVRVSASLFYSSQRLGLLLHTRKRLYINIKYFKGFEVKPEIESQNPNPNPTFDLNWMPVEVRTRC